MEHDEIPPMNNTQEAELRQLLADAYGITTPNIALIRVGEDGNQTFKVIANGSTCIARIYGDPGRQHPDWARYEVELLAHLANDGISVAAPIAALDHTLLQFLPAGTGPTAPVALFTFAEGGVDWPTSPSRAHLLGTAFASLHGAADSFRTTAVPRTFDLERLLFVPLGRIGAYLNASDPQDLTVWNILVETATLAASILANVPNTDGAIGPIHGDLHQGNCHFNTDNTADQLKFFDFSNAGVGWRIYDLSGFLWPLRDDTIRDPAIQEACDSFLKGYRSVRPLLREEEKAIPAAVKARDFWEAGNWLEFGRDLHPATVRDGLYSMADQFQRFPLRL